MKKLISISFVVTILLSLFSCTSSNTPANLAKSMMEDLKEAKYEKIPDYYYYGDLEQDEADKTKELILALTKDKVGKEHENKGGIKDFTVLSETISKDGLKAVVEMEITFNNSEEKENQEVEFINRNGKWYADLGK